jgi:outer membrane protein assembly factor BamB
MVAGEKAWTVFVGGDNGIIAAYNAKNGEQLWRTEAQVPRCIKTASTVLVDNAVVPVVSITVHAR